MGSKLCSLVLSLRSIVAMPKIRFDFKENTHRRRIVMMWFSFIYFFTSLHFISKLTSLALITTETVPVLSGPCSPRHFSAWQIESVRNPNSFPPLSLLWLGMHMRYYRVLEAHFSLCLAAIGCLWTWTVLVQENVSLLSQLSCLSLFLLCLPVFQG